MKKYTLEQKEEIVKLRRRGLKFKEIANIVNINNLTTISEVCAENGLARKKYNSKFKYDIGQRHNSFVILTKTDPIIGKIQSYTRWQCKCDCGNIFLITTKQISRGQQSCGCHKFISLFRKSLTDEQANFRKVLHEYKSKAKARNFDWALTEEQAVDLLKSNCFYCGIVPSRKISSLKHCKEIFVSGIDRKNSNKGYEIDNCVSCCKRCNAAKNNMTEEEFKNWIKRLVSFMYGINI